MVLTTDFASRRVLSMFERSTVQQPIPAQSARRGSFGGLMRGIAKPFDEMLGGFLDGFTGHEGYDTDEPKSKRD
jgi:hypothetical protein